MKYALLLLTLILSTSLNGQVMIAPVRVILTNHSRSAEVSLVNSSDQEQTYRLSWTQLQMMPDGSVKEITEPMEGAPWANSMVRFSPREVTLPAKGVQSVRLLARIPADTTGEFRSHLLVKQVPTTEPITKPEIEPKEVSISIRVLVSVSVPVIVRSGPMNVTGSISCSLANKDTLECLLNREGNQSLYGDVMVRLISSSGKPLVIGQVRGLAVYVPMTQRSIKVSLTLPPGITLAAGSKLEVSLSDNPSNKPLAQTSVMIP